MLSLELLLAYLDDEGDQRLLEDIFNSHVKQMIRYAETFVHNRHDAEDIVGDLFERIASRNFDAVRSIQRDTDLRNYLLKATKNASINALNKRKRAAISLDDEEEMKTGRIKAVTDDSFVDYICRESEREEVMRAIASLSDKYRNALYYHFVMDKSVAETAQLMFQPLSTTKQQLVRGKKKLLERLKAEREKSDGDHKR